MLLDEGFLSLKKDKFTEDNSENLKENLNKIKDTVDDMELDELYTKKNNILVFFKNLIIDIATKGLILGPLVIPFSLVCTTLTLVCKKIMKNIKSEADKKLYIESFRFYISQLILIKSKNPKLEHKIDKTIQSLNNMIDKLLE